MDIFTFFLGLGFLGLLVMAASGLGARHAGGAHHAGGPRTPGTHHGSATHAGMHGRHGGSAVRTTRGGVQHWLAPLLNPRLFFTLSFGFGLSGLILRHHASEWLVVGGALVGAVAFERVAVRPIWNFLLRFGSRPALTLESGVMDEARAVTAFDANGQGLISLELDGQVVQVLGTLCAEDRAAGIRVHAGDALVVQDVDARRNSCVVSRGTLPRVPTF